MAGNNSDVIQACIKMALAGDDLTRFRKTADLWFNELRRQMVFADYSYEYIEYFISSLRQKWERARRAGMDRRGGLDEV